MDVCFPAHEIDAEVACVILVEIWHSEVAPGTCPTRIKYRYPLSLVHGVVAAEFNGVRNDNAHSMTPVLFEETVAAGPYNDACAQVRDFNAL